MLERWLTVKLQGLIGENLVASDGVSKPFVGHVVLGYPPPRGDDGKLHLPCLSLTVISTTLDSAERKISSRTVNEETKKITTVYKRWLTETRLQLDILAQHQWEMIGNEAGTFVGYERQLLDLFALKLAWMVDEDGHLVRCRVLSTPRPMSEPGADYHRSIMEVQIDHGVYETEVTDLLATEEPGIVTEGKIE